MWRYVVGAGALLSILISGSLLWKSFAGTRSAADRTPPAAAPASLGAVDVAPPVAASEQTREARRFARYDADRNGQVSRDEYLLTRRKAFGRLDLDRDGKLSFDEYAVKAVRKFASADRDRTGALNASEFLATRVARKTNARGDCGPPLRTAKPDGGGDDDG